MSFYEPKELTARPYPEASEPGLDMQLQLEELQKAFCGIRQFISVFTTVYFCDASLSIILPTYEIFSYTGLHSKTRGTVTNQIGSRSNVSGLYSEGAWFESPTGHQIFRFKIFEIS
jgi:hypothetical protein